MKICSGMTCSALIAATILTTPVIADTAAPLDISDLSGTSKPAAAGEDELVTDRPDFTESSEVVRKGWMQMESGLSLEKAAADGRRTFSIGNPLMRIGLSPRLE